MAKKVVPISSKPRGPALSLVLATEERASPSIPATPIDDFSKAKARSAEPASTGLIARAVYGSVYCVSFGVVFSALVLGKLIPGRRLVAKGLLDGTMAARQSMDWFGTRRGGDAHDPDENTMKA